MSIALQERARSAGGVAAPLQLRAELLARHDGLAVSLARRFRTHRELQDDLEQVARIGLIHAADRFDPSRGRPFEAFARATITGELKRHLRDHAWPMRFPRSLHDCYLEVMAVLDDLTQVFGRSPLVSEVAERVGLTVEQVLEAMEVTSPLSLDSARPDGRSLEPSEDDPGPERLEDDALVASLVARLTERQQRVIELRFGEGLTQLEIARRLGVSQMCVSRLLTKCLRQMRERAEALEREPFSVASSGGHGLGLRGLLAVPLDDLTGEIDPGADVELAEDLA